MTRKGSSTMTDAKVGLVRKAWWDSVCRKGDPQRQPRLITDAFEAGWAAALEQSDAVMGEAAPSDATKRMAETLGCEFVPHTTPIAPVQDDDAEWLRENIGALLYTGLELKVGVRIDAQKRLERIVSRLSRQAGG